MDSAAGSPRVLVVDDDADVLASLERGLRLSGFEVSTAVDGAEALQWKERPTPEPKPGEVRVAIRFEKGSVHLSVSDNGRGLPAGDLAPGADGLANMRERLTQLGGSCRITNLPDGGTEVGFILPIPTSSPNRR